MAKYTTTAGTIATIEPIGTSGNGNPRYRVTLMGGAVIETKIDASINYGITNTEYSNVPVVLTLSEARIVGVRTQDGQHMAGAQD